ncbi:MAG TPA: hypothetical protein VLS96_17250 [Nodosilinea sp.]|nr:hypothetical protein [Nodosilinea sp.]
MATSSRRFQSQTVARLVAGYRQVAHSAGRWLRQGRTALVWGLQVAAYPLYAAVQGARLGYRQLRAARPWQPVWARLQGQGQLPLVRADTPIRALLSVLQPPVLSSTTVRPSGLQLVSVYGGWLRQSRAGAVLTPGQWHLLPLAAPIRGVASDLATRRLVLATVDNGIFDGLTAAQQQRLQRAIALMLAEYARVGRQQALDQRWRRPWLPLPQAAPRAVLPFRWVPQALRWMQTSALAAATNVFGEARQQHWRRERGAIAPLSSPLSTQTSHPFLASAPPMLPRPALLARSGAERGGELMVTASAEAAGLRGPLVSQLGSSLGSQSSPSVPLEFVAQAQPDLPPAIDYRQLQAPAALEVKATPVGYVDPPLVTVLRGLDWVLFGFETWLRGLWAWLKRHW